jgi:hypothetical protein
LEAHVQFLPGKERHVPTKVLRPGTDVEATAVEWCGARIFADTGANKEWLKCESSDMAEWEDAMDPSDAELTPDEVRRLAILEFEAMNPHLAGADIDAVLSSSEMGKLAPKLPSHQPGDLLVVRVESFGPLTEVLGWDRVFLSGDGATAEFRLIATTSSESPPFLQCGDPGIIEVGAVRVRFRQGSN